LFVESRMSTGEKFLSNDEKETAVDEPSFGMSRCIVNAQKPWLISDWPPLSNNMFQETTLAPLDVWQPMRGKAS